MSGLSVNHVRNTSILEITFSSQNSDEARRLANMIARTYVRYDGERSKEIAVRSREFLDSLVVDQEKKIDFQERKIRDFKLKNNMYSLDGDALSIISELNDYESELYTLKQKLT